MLEDSPKNVDGDGQYMAAASTANTSSYNNYAAVQVQEAMYGDYGANAGMSTQQQINNTNTNNNNTHLPQRRSSVDGSSGRDHERTMLKLQRGSSNFSSSSGGGSNNSQKRDIGREAIRAKAADDLDHVHKIIPKSKDAKLSQGITAQHKKRRLELTTEFLKKVEIHDKVLGEILKPSEIRVCMALAAKIETFMTGDVIICQAG